MAYDDPAKRFTCGIFRLASLAGTRSASSEPFHWRRKWSEVSQRRHEVCCNAIVLIYVKHMVIIDIFEVSTLMRK